MIRHEIAIGQTYAAVLAEERYVPSAEEAVRSVRSEIEDYIQVSPFRDNPRSP